MGLKGHINMLYRKKAKDRLFEDFKYKFQLH